MSRFQRLLLLIFCLTSSLAIHAQDIHFTQYNMSPMTLNPANIGSFAGTIRFGGIYRDQWRSISNFTNYSTPSIWVDSPVMQGFRKSDWIGVGVMLLQDNAGTFNYKTTAFKIGASYHLALDKKRKNVLTLGLHYGNENYRLSSESLRFGMGYNSSLEYDQNQSGENYAQLQMAEPSITDWDLGLLFSSQLNKTTDMKIGFAMFHMFEPNASFAGGAGGGIGGGQSATRVGRRSVVHGQFNLQLNDRTTFSPSFLFQTMRGADEIVVQGKGGYLFDEDRDITLLFGAGYRLSDAIQVLTGAKIKKLQIGLAYDINTSQLSNATKYRGGFELAANYIISIYKPPVVVPKVLCPRY